MHARRAHRYLSLEAAKVGLYNQTLSVDNMAGAEHDLAVARAYRAGTLSSGDLPEIREEDARWARLNRTFPDDKKMPLILRYEAHYHRQYIQTLHELEAMQERRKGNATPLARVDFTGAP